MQTPTTTTTRPARLRTDGRARDGRRVRDQRGSAVIEAVIGVPAFGLFVGLIVFAGRLSIAHQAVESAANDAARVASIARTQSAAETDAATSARTSLANQKVNCRTVQVRLDASAFTKPAGTPGTITATVSCRVNLSDLSLPGVPGAKTVTATVTSPLDTYREKTSGFTNPQGPAAATRPVLPAATAVDSGVRR